MRPLSLSVAVVALGLASVNLVPQRSIAAPLPAAYTAAAGGDLVAVSLDATTGPDLPTARLAVAQATMNGGPTPDSRATAINLVVNATGLGIALQSNAQTAPPDHTSPDAGTIAAGTSPGRFDLALLNTSVQARTEAAVACAPAGGPIAKSEVQTAGAIVNPSGVGTIVDTGDATVNGTVAIFPEPLSDPLNRALVSTATGTITTNTFLNGQVSLSITGPSTLQAFASGEPGGADTSYNPGAVSVTVGSVTTPLGLGASQTFNGSTGSVVVTVNQPTVAELADGRTATASVAVVTAQVTVTTGTTTLATATVDLLPLRASAVAPPGGIDCAPPAPVLNNPADGSTTADTTPTFNGTAVPGAEVEIIVDGNPIGTTTATSAGLFTFTPTAPLAADRYTATATQTTDGGTSQESNANDFTIVGPPVLQDPADGTVTNDTTPTFTGTALPGAEVDILVDGNPIGTTTALADRSFSFTPATALSPGDHQASARARLNGVTSGTSNVNDFTIDTAAPAAPTLIKPTDGSVTGVTRPTFAGTAEPGAEVEIFVDGNSIGTTTANGSGGFSITPTTPLTPGEHEAFLGATDEAGNDSPPSNTNGFRIDTQDPDAPGISSPGDGSTTTDRTPTITGTAEPGSQVIIYIDGEQVGSTTADEDGNFSFTIPDPLSLGEHEVSAVAVDEAGNRSAASDPMSFGVLAAEANAGGQNQLGDTGGPQGWLPAVGVLGLLAGAAVLTLARWRRRSSRA